MTNDGLLLNFIHIFHLEVLKSEVEDLRILVQAADKDVETLKRARNSDAIESGRRYAGLESKVGTDFLFYYENISVPFVYFFVFFCYIFLGILYSLFHICCFNHPIISHHSCAKIFEVLH